MENGTYDFVVVDAGGLRDRRNLGLEGVKHIKDGEDGSAYYETSLQGSRSLINLLITKMHGMEFIIKPVRVNRS